MSSIFENLNKINVNEHTESKNGLTYLSWAWAWGEIKKAYPEAVYEVVKFDGKPYVYDEHLGYMCYTTVTVGRLTHEMWLPVMDGANKAMKNEPYQYTVKNSLFKYAKLCDDGVYRDKYGNEQTEYLTKTCEAATMFDINKTIMRCLVKNLAMFGLGLYIYAGEDLPECEDLPEGDAEQDLTEIQINSLLSLASRKGVTREQLEKKYKAKLEKLTGKQYREAVEGLNKMEDADVSGKA